MSEQQEPHNGADGSSGATDQDEPSLDELFPDVDLGEDDGSEGYQNHDELDQDLDDLMGREREEDSAAPVTSDEPDDGPSGVLESEPAVGDNEPESVRDTALEEEEDIPATASAPPSASGEVPVLREKVDPTRMPHAGLSDDELSRLAELLTADLEARLDTIIVEAVDHEMDRVSTALKNAIHRQLKGRLPDIIAEFVSETRSL
ncbi:MAG: hypothetical protein ACQERR_02270 [Pseudomonadota bacterium]